MTPEIGGRGGGMTKLLSGGLQAVFFSVVLSLLMKILKIYGFMSSLFVGIGIILTEVAGEDSVPDLALEILQGNEPL